MASDGAGYRPGGATKGRLGLTAKAPLDRSPTAALAPGEARGTQRRHVAAYWIAPTTFSSAFSSYSVTIRSVVRSSPATEAAF